MQDATLQRASYIKNNQKRMLNSLLNRFKDSIIVDRLMVEDNETFSLVIEPDEIKRLAPLQYVKLQKKRNHKFDNFSNDWKTFYEPIPCINENIYCDLLALPNMEE